MEADYKVKLEVFEGPLDLLLYLIKQDEIDIYDISLERITRQYLEYLQAFKELNIELAGEFIVMAANLIYLKSRSLLPLDQHGYVITADATFDPPTSPLDENGQGIPYAVFGFGAHLVEIAVDPELGTVRVLKITAAHDVGRAINPTLIEGQIEGGAAQGLGMALMEEFFPGKGENLHDYLIPSAGDMPPVESILIEDPSPVGPFGAKGIGEQAVIPTAPAILNAIHDAIGVRIHRVPATPDRIRAAIRRHEPAQHSERRAGLPPDSRRDAGATKDNRG